MKAGKALVVPDVYRAVGPHDGRASGADGHGAARVGKGQARVVAYVQAGVVARQADYLGVALGDEDAVGGVGVEGGGASGRRASR